MPPSRYIEMMAVSDSTLERAIRMVAKIGRPVATNVVTSVGSSACFWKIRPSTTKTSTGTPIEPIAPMGSRRKTLISTQVSLNRPRSIPRVLGVSPGSSGR